RMPVYGGSPGTLFAAALGASRPGDGRVWQTTPAMARGGAGRAIEGVGRGRGFDARLSASPRVPLARDDRRVPSDRLRSRRRLTRAGCFSARAELGPGGPATGRWRGARGRR